MYFVYKYIMLIVEIHDNIIFPPILYFFLVLEPNFF